MDSVQGGPSGHELSNVDNKFRSCTWWSCCGGLSCEAQLQIQCRYLIVHDQMGRPVIMNDSTFDHDVNSQAFDWVTLHRKMGRERESLESSFTIMQPVPVYLMHQSAAILAYSELRMFPVKPTVTFEFGNLIGIKIKFWSEWEPANALDWRNYSRLLLCG